VQWTITRGGRGDEVVLESFPHVSQVSASQNFVTNLSVDRLPSFLLRITGVQQHIKNRRGKIEQQPAGFVLDKVKDSISGDSIASVTSTGNFLSRSAIVIRP
jgi:hypothetical protein